MANDVANKDTRRLERDRRDKEAEILRIRKRISEIDQRVCRLAELQLKPVGDCNLRPAELAQHIVTNVDKHKWLPDNLGREDRFAPQFSADDIQAARRSRLSLGADLAYIDCTLPSPNDLPDSASVCAIHSDLVRAANLMETAEQKQLPRMSTRVTEAVARAEQLLADIRAVRSALELMARANQAWLRPYYDAWLSKGGDSEQMRPFNPLFDELCELLQRRQRFLERPVQLPTLGESHDEVIEAVQRAKRGARPFGVWPFGKQEAREAFAKIKVTAQVPNKNGDWQHVADYFDFQNKVATFAARWNAMAKELHLPAAPNRLDDAVTWMSEVRSNADAVLAAARAYRESSYPMIQKLFPHGLDADRTARDPQEAERVIETLETNIATEELSAARSGVQSAVERLQQCSGRIVNEMSEFLRDSVGSAMHSDHEIADRWQDLVRELQRVHSLRPELDTAARVANLVRISGAPVWADKLRCDPVLEKIDAWTHDIWQESWQFRRLEAYLSAINRRDELKQLAEERVKCERTLAKAMTEVVRLRTYVGLQKRLGRGGRLAALQQFVTAIRRIGTGTGVRARRYQGDARRAMEKCVEAVPCWIMPTWRASESLPPALGAFDLVIVDEASQSDAMALPALIRAQKILVVGDDRQVSPSPVGIEERKLLQLRHSFLQDQPFADLLMPGSSLYELALAVFPGERVLLNEHFRCVEPIIRFSFQFYPEKIEPVRIAKPSERLDPPLVDLYLPHGERDAQKINEAEAIAIVDEIERLVNDPTYEKRTIGVVSLIGRKQAQLIQNALVERIGEDAFLKHKITCGDSATFQGKERDIMFVSMIASPGKATAQTSLLWEQRFNVALSRARDRTYLVRSVKPEDLRNPRDLKLRAINHFFNPMPVPAEQVEELMDLCESDFERDVFQRLVKLGYRVTPQVAVGEFRIDLVVDGEDDRRLAIELDGDRHHGPDRWFEDWNRQKILERVGWTFWRCWASSFTLDSEGCMDELVATLTQMKIDPIGVGEGRHPYTEHRMIEIDDLTFTAEMLGEDETTEPAVDIGDRIVISFDDNPKRHITLTITEDKADLLNGIVSASEPPGQQFLGAFVEDEISVIWDGKTRQVTILEIEKSRSKRRGAGRQRTTSPKTPDRIFPDRKDPSPDALPAETASGLDAEKPVSQTSRDSARVQQALLPDTEIETDGKPTDAELAKYREYKETMREHGIRCRPLNAWIESYRQQRKLN